MSPHSRSCLAVVAVIAFARCGENVPPLPTEPPPVPQATQPPAPASPPAPVPSEPTPPPPGRNHPPTVTLSASGRGSCHPTPDRTCQVEMVADAHDRDGDALRLEWHGCTSGTGVTEPCTINRPGEFTATVIVTDVHGAAARESATILGTNLPPVVRIGPQRPPDPAPANTFYAIAGDEPYDPDDYPPYMNMACPHARVTTSGPCHAGIGLCGGAGDAFDIDLTTTAGPGTCVVEATVTDPWGAVGRDRFSFGVLAP